MEKKPAASGLLAGIAAMLIIGAIILAAIGIFAYRQVNNYLASTNANQQQPPQATPTMYTPPPTQTPTPASTPLFSNINGNANMSDPNMNANMNSGMYTNMNSNMSRNANHMSNANMNSNSYAPPPRADIDPPQATIQARKSDMFYSSKVSLGRILNIWEDYDVYEYERKGMRIHVKFETYDNVRNVQCFATAFFGSRNGLLKDYNGKYRSEDGYIAVTDRFAPAYEITSYNDFHLFIPYDELGGAEGDLTYEVLIYTQDGIIITRSEIRSFKLTY